MKRFGLIITVVALTAGSAWAVGWSSSASGSAAAVAPFVGADTFLVIRGDVSAFDVRSAFAKADTFARRMLKDDYSRKEQQELEEARREASRWVSEFTAAGGREIYLVLGMADMRDGPFLVVPAGGGADTEAIINLLTTGHRRPPAGARRDTGRPMERPMPVRPVRPEPPAEAPPVKMPPTEAPRPGSGETYGDTAAVTSGNDPTAKKAVEEPRPRPSGPFPACRRIRGAVVAGSPRTLRRLEQMRPANRPELARAMGAVRGGLIQVALIPPAAAKAELATAEKELPPEMGIRSLSELAKGFSWAALRAEGPPRMSIDLVIQASDGAAARALGQAADNLFRWIEKTKPEPLGTTSDLSRALNLFRPVVSGDRLTLSLSSGDIDDILFVHLAGPIAEARRLAKRAVSMSRIHNILNCCMMHKSDNKDQWPKDLRSIEDYLGSREMLKNPDDPSRSIGYGYIRPPRQSRIEDPSRRLVVYELREDWTRGVAVGFADGHVEAIKDRDKFRKLLDEARRNAAKE